MIGFGIAGFVHRRGGGEVDDLGSARRVVGTSLSGGSAGHSTNFEGSAPR